MVELGVALAIVGVLTAIGYAYLDSKQARTSAANGLREITSMLSLTRATAMSRGASAVFLIRPKDSNPSVLEYVAFVDTNANFLPTDVTGVVESTDTLIDRRDLSDRISFATLTPTLVPPFKAALGTTPTPCTFCDVKTNYVTIIFHNDGTVALGSTPKNYPVGGSFSLGLYDVQRSGRTLVDGKTFVILSRTGAVFPFDRS
jgi:hypothetical protein